MLYTIEDNGVKLSGTYTVIDSEGDELAFLQLPSSMSSIAPCLRDSLPQDTFVYKYYVELLNSDSRELFLRLVSINSTPYSGDLDSLQEKSTPCSQSKSSHTNEISRKAVFHFTEPIENLNILVSIESWPINFDPYEDEWIASSCFSLSWLSARTWGPSDCE